MAVVFLLCILAVLVAIRMAISSGELCRCGHRRRAHRGLRHARCRYCRCELFEAATFEDFTRLSADDRVSEDFDTRASASEPVAEMPKGVIVFLAMVATLVIGAAIVRLATTHITR